MTSEEWSSSKQGPWTNIFDNPNYYLPKIQAKLQDESRLDRVASNPRSHSPCIIMKTEWVNNQGTTKRQKLNKEGYLRWFIPGDEATRSPAIYIRLDHAVSAVKLHKLDPNSFRWTPYSLKQKDGLLSVQLCGNQCCVAEDHMRNMSYDEWKSRESCFDLLQCKCDGSWIKFPCSHDPPCLNVKKGDHCSRCVLLAQSGSSSSGIDDELLESPVAAAAGLMETGGHGEAEGISAVRQALKLAEQFSTPSSDEDKGKGSKVGGGGGDLEEEDVDTQDERKPASLSTIPPSKNDEDDDDSDGTRM